VTKTRLKFSLSLVAVIALIAVVVGVVAGRASGSSSSSGGGGGAGGAVSGKKIDVIIKASDSSFWQSMLAGARKASADYGVKVGLFGPTSETDVNEQVQLVENSISRGDDAIKRARQAGKKIIIADTAVTTPDEGFIGTDNVKAGQQAGVRLCQLAKQEGKTSGDVLIESSVAGVQTIKDRDAGFKAGLSTCGLRAAVQRFNNNDINTAASQVNDVMTANQNLVGVFADNNVSGVGAARAITDNKASDRIPVVGFDSDPQENAALKSGAIDALVVQNPYFFGYQGVAEAGAAAANTQVPPKLDPGAVVADQGNMNTPAVKQLLNPPTAKAQG
jgi:ribose transport system substrate-binding protein